MEAVLTFNNKSRIDSAVSFYQDKIVLIGQNSHIKEPQLGIPYMCSFEVFDTNPQNPVKGARIVDVQRPMVADGVSYAKVPHGLEITLFCKTDQARCIIDEHTFDIRHEIKKLMVELRCHVDYAKIDKVAASAKEKLG
ncbi:hypothetical protein D3C78_20900 [compost metagenome]